MTITQRVHKSTADTGYPPEISKFTAYLQNYLPGELKVTLFDWPRVYYNWTPPQQLTSETLFVKLNEATKTWEYSGSVEDYRMERNDNGFDVEITMVRKTNKHYCILAMFLFFISIGLAFTIIFLLHLLFEPQHGYQQ